MKIIITTSIFLLLLFDENISAQNTKLNFEAEFTPKIALRAAIGSNSFNEDIKPLILFDAGFNVKYSVNEKSTIGSGIFYSVKGFNLKVNTSDPYNLLTMLKYNVHYTYNYAELPIFYEHTINNFRLKAGLIYQRLLSANTTYKNLPDSLINMSKDEFIEIADNKMSSSELKAENYKMNNIGLLLSFGQNKNISDKIYCGWATEFKTNLLPVLDSSVTVFNIYLYSFGINLKIGLK